MKSINNQKTNEDLWGRICEDYYDKNSDGDYIIQRDDGFRDKRSIKPYFRTELSNFEKKILQRAKGVF